MTIHKIWTDIKWIGGMTWMAAKRDMVLIEEEQWLQDEFLDFWIPQKKDELDFIGIVGGLLAAVVTTCLSLPGIADTHWLIPGSWYCTLIFSIGSVALAFQQKGALSGVALGKAIRERSTQRFRIGTSKPRNLDETIPSRPSFEQLESTPTLTSQPSFERLESYDIVAWQAPVQLLTYALGFFFFGLLGFLGQPLVAGEWGPRSKSALFVMGFSLLPLGLYFFSTWRVQKYAGRITEKCHV